MPTPFNHLIIAQQLLVDEQIPTTVRHSLTDERGAFLLGNIAVDARVTSGAAREETHFYAYHIPATKHPWRIMLDKYPTLQKADSAEHRAFLAGYTAHLAVDVTWTKRMLGPHFVRCEWGESITWRFFVLHLMLIYMDERDLLLIEDWQPNDLLNTHPDGWLPFMSDTVLANWRDFVGQQIVPGGESKTMEILSKRVLHSVEELRALLDSPENMQSMVWDNVTRDVLAEVEAECYAESRRQVCAYFEKYG